MRRTMTLVIAAAVSAAFLLPAAAAWGQKPQRGPEPGFKPAFKKEKGKEKDEAAQQGKFYDKLSDILSEELDLSAEQKAKVKTAVEKSKPKLQSMQDELKNVHERMRKEMFAMKEGIRENLSMDQKERFDQIIAKLMGRGMMGGGMGQGRMGMGGRPGMMDERMERMRQIKMKRMRMQQPGFEEEIEVEEGGEPGMMPPPGGMGPEGPGPE
ncbi:MAG: hypothetical protein HY748_17060 [Elusimicrobia bacterium]|nr:hypothetical protein [Elusimicrobiota bacterium]